jgi:putative oxidoreductase
METGLLLIRAALGLGLAAHGVQKLSGWFGGYGVTGTGDMFEKLGFRPGRLLATAAGLGELGGGLALAAGAVTPLAAAVVIATMLVAIWSVHLGKGFFSQKGGYELPLLYATGAAGVALVGPGPLSVDALLGLPLWGMKWGLAAIALGVVGALPPLLARQAHQARAVRLASRT